MASLTSDPNGHKRIGIDTPDGKRHTIRLGKMPLRTAEDYRDNIEHLHANWNTPHLIARKVLEWANALDDRIYHRLVKSGLLPAREVVQVQALTLGPFLERWKAAQTFKINTAIFYRNTLRILLAFFGPKRVLASIKAEDADRFKAFMANKELLSPATVGRRIGACRTLWKAAIRWELVTKNPFDGIPVGNQCNDARKFYVSPEIIDQIMPTLPDAEWRLIVALSRWAGLRCPSEHFALRWRDVNWEAGTLTIHCPKMERNPKYARRVIPLFYELRPYLLEVFEEAPEGAEFVITTNRLSCGNLRTGFLKHIKRAGLQPWPRLFHNLRASRESELMRAYDLATACQWIGNSPKIAAEHYLMAVEPDADFHRAVNGPKGHRDHRGENLLDSLQNVHGAERGGKRLGFRVASR